MIALSLAFLSCLGGRQRVGGVQAKADSNEPTLLCFYFKRGQNVVVDESRPNPCTRVLNRKKIPCWGARDREGSEQVGHGDRISALYLHFLTLSRGHRQTDRQTSSSDILQSDA